MNSRCRTRCIGSSIIIYAAQDPSPPGPPRDDTRVLGCRSSVRIHGLRVCQRAFCLALDNKIVDSAGGDPVRLCQRWGVVIDRSVFLTQPQRQFKALFKLIEDPRRVGLEDFKV